ncbi:cell division protein ZipA [Thiolapillus sp.]
MDADQLRLILLLAGMVLVVAIYLWDRYKRSRSQLKGLSLRQARRLQRELSREAAVAEDEVPSFSAVVEPQEDAVAKTESEPALTAPRPAAVPELELDTEEMAQETEPGFSSNVDDDYLHADPAEREKLPQMVVQIALVKKEGDFQGGDIQAAMEAANLQPGAMSIYHRHDSRYPDRVLFSVANMVNPGHFPLQEMDGFATPGLLLFTQLPGVRDGMEIYTDMLYAANQLAGILGGVLQDETHSVLSKQTIQHTKDAIMEHRRKLRLAKLHK